MNNASAPDHTDTACACGHDHDAGELDALITLRDWLRYAVTRFNHAGVHFGHGCDNVFDEAVWLLFASLHLPFDNLEVFLDASLLDSERQLLAERIEQRCSERLPTAYLTGEAWLGDLRFVVSPQVIIPRSYFVEHLEQALAPWVMHPEKITSALDLCCGSACLAILMAQSFARAQIDAVDISPDALQIAHKNIARHALQERIRVFEGDLFAPLGTARYELIISNPPYVDAAAMQALPPEYRHEPALALAAGEDGLEIVRRILAGARQHLTPNGILAVEIGHNQAALEAAFPALPFTWLPGADNDAGLFLLHAAELP